MKQFWDERYGQSEYAYGEQPNNFFRQQLEMIRPGKLLMPAEGEGRNAVYAATLGWDVFAFDQSVEGQKKAKKLAQLKGVEINYIVNELQDLPYAPTSFDAMGLIYAHFPAAKKSEYNKALSFFLKPGGVLIFEAFSKRNLAYRAKNEKVGGPSELDMLFSKEELLNDFANFDISYIQEEEVELSEGLYHNGTGVVMRLVGRKKQDKR
ncbi:MAG TPA: class I SAM-dependent methyltransferase [Saprospiraceae bacterium]|nr:class I SAM-dependent methyltransferase [Saprospiraceae bacterium]HMQ85475.1 class I SAM-dependent methyltransferase [Saprospiraceae bacterium]